MAGNPGLALAIAPRNASTYAALGFTHHLRGDPDGAIELYHQSLSLKPDDTFTCEMLKEALKDVLQATSDPLSLPPMSAPGGAAASAVGVGRGASVVKMDVSAAHSVL